MEAPINPKKLWSKSYWTKFQSLYKFLFRAKRPFKLTRGGWIFILYTIGVGAGAINTGNNLLFLLFGLFLGLIMASGVLSDLTLWGVRVEAILPLSSHAGQPLYIPLKLTNTKSWVPSLSVRVEMEGTLHGAPVRAQAFAASIGRSSSTTVLLLVHARDRGELKITSLKLSTRFPFGLLTKSWSVTGPLLEPIVIYPELVPVDGDLLFSLAQEQEQQMEGSQRGEGVNLHGLREFQTFDNPKRIHWRASAKRPSGWLIKEMEQDRHQQVTFLWPGAPFFGGWSKEREERFVSLTASLIRVVENMGKRAVLLISSPAIISSTEGDLLWKFLALVEVAAPIVVGKETEAALDSAIPLEKYAA